MSDQDKTIEQDKKLASERKIEKEVISKKKVSSEGNKETKNSLKEQPKKSAEDREKKESIFEKINQQEENDALRGVIRGGDGKDSIKKQAKDISAINNAEDQVKKLVELAIKKDPFTSIKVARHIDENYVLDKLHDELVEEKTRRILLEKGLLKKA